MHVRPRLLSTVVLGALLMPSAVAAPGPAQGVTVGVGPAVASFYSEGNAWHIVLGTPGGTPGVIISPYDDTPDTLLLSLDIDGQPTSESGGVITEAWGRATVVDPTGQQPDKTIIFFDGDGPEGSYTRQGKAFIIEMAQPFVLVCTQDWCDQVFDFRFTARLTMTAPIPLWSERGMLGMYTMTGSD